MPGRKGIWATLIGTVFAHRMFDLFPTVLLVIWVVTFAQLPHWAVMTLIVVLGVGMALFAFAVVGARGPIRASPRAFEDGLGRVRVLIVRARIGLAVMRRPLPAAIAAGFQFLGWFFQLLAVYAAMHAFRIYEPLVAAGLVLLMMNVVTVVPFWPGNVGLIQAAVAVSLAQYGVRYAKGFAFGIGLQLIEASVGIGVGTVFLAREGISYAMLKDMETEADHEEASAIAPRGRARGQGLGAGLVGELHVRDDEEELGALRRALPGHLAARLNERPGSGRGLDSKRLARSFASSSSAAPTSRYFQRRVVGIPSASSLSASSTAAPWLGRSSRTSHSA